MTKTIDIITPEGDEIDIEVEELSSTELYYWAAKAPDSMHEAAQTGKTPRVGPEIVEYLIELVESQTVLTRKLIDELDRDELSRLFNGVVAYAFGEDADLTRENSADDYKLDNELDFNDDGSLDLDDWR